MKIKQIKDLAKLPVTRYLRNNTIIDIKWGPNLDWGWVVVDNDWGNLVRDLVFRISYEEIIRDGWVKSPGVAQQTE